MALEGSTSTSNAISNAIRGALNVFSKLNKTEGGSENPEYEQFDEYESTLQENDIIKLKSQWLSSYSRYFADVEPSQKLAFEYWIGKQRTDDELLSNNEKSIIDNQLFSAIETFLPIATRANPDPLVQSDPSDQGQMVADCVKNALVFEADRMKFKSKLKADVRNWLIYKVGIIKLAWNAELEQIETIVINPKLMIFDKDGHWDEAGRFTGDYLGERKTMCADDLAALFPKNKDVISKKVQGKMDTKIEYIEWWYKNIDVFFTMGDAVLGKYKNPHWNYDGVNTVESETGALIETEIKGKNHFDKMWSPYVGLSIFSTGLQPHDETSLILQNIPIQDMVNRRYSQIDKNVRSMNEGIIVNGSIFSEDQAAQAASMKRRGGAIRVPVANGVDIRTAIDNMSPNPIPDQVFEMLRDGRSELKDIFGVSGSTAQGVASQDTVRGKILVNQMDSSRIGGGITEKIEQVADTVYNWWVQMMFVHWDSEHYINTIGATGAAEMLSISNQDFALINNLSVTVKEGSLVPKDPLTQRNEAMDLWSANAIDPRTLYSKLGWGDPNEAATQLILWQMVQKGALPPTAYLPDFQMPQQAQLPQQGVGGPAVNPIGPATPPQPSPDGTQGAEQIESKQLLDSVPIK